MKVEKLSVNLKLQLYIKVILSRNLILHIHRQAINLLRQTVIQNADKAQNKIKFTKDNVAGVQLTNFTMHTEGSDVYQLTGTLGVIRPYIYAILNIFKIEGHLESRCDPLVDQS